MLSFSCKSCDSSFIRFKLFNKIEIDKKFLFGLTCGISLTTSAYLVYKLWKFNKNLNQSIESINTLTRKFEYIIIDLTHIDEARIGNTERILTKQQDKPLIKKKNSKINLNDNLSNDQLSTKSSRSKFSSSASVASLSDYFETPLTSPQASSSESDDENEEQFKDPIEDTLSASNSEIDLETLNVKQNLKPIKSVLKNRKLDDNLLALYEQSIEYLKELVDKNENEYKQDENNVDKLIEYIKSLFALAERTDGNFNFVKESHYKCRDLSKKALELNNQIYVTHKWYSISIGRTLEYLGINEKVKASVDFKKHLDLAIKLNDSDYYLLYMRGRWAYGICNLNRVEKYAVKLIYGDMPSCTMENALEDFMRVEQLYPNKFIGNLLYLAKCQIHFNNIKKAVDLLNLSLKITPKTSNELSEHQEIKSLLDKYQIC